MARSMAPTLHRSVRHYFFFLRYKQRVEAVQKLSPCISFLPKNPASLSAAPQSEAAKKKKTNTHHGVNGQKKQGRNIRFHT